MGAMSELTEGAGVMRTAIGVVGVVEACFRLQFVLRILYGKNIKIL